MSLGNIFILIHLPVSVNCLLCLSNICKSKSALHISQTCPVSNSSSWSKHLILAHLRCTQIIIKDWRHRKMSYLFDEVKSNSKKYCSYGFAVTGWGLVNELIVSFHRVHSVSLYSYGSCEGRGVQIYLEILGWKIQTPCKLTRHQFNGGSGV